MFFLIREGWFRGGKNRLVFLTITRKKIKLIRFFFIGFQYLKCTVCVFFSSADVDADLISVWFSGLNFSESVSV